MTAISSKCTFLCPQEPKKANFCSRSWSYWKWLQFAEFHEALTLDHPNAAVGGVQSYGQAVGQSYRCPPHFQTHWFLIKTYNQNGLFHMYQWSCLYKI